MYPDAPQMSMMLDERELSYRLIVPDDFRPTLIEALVDDLAALVPLLSDDDEDTRAWRRPARALLDGLLAGRREVESPVAGSSYPHGTIAERARAAIGDGRRDDTLAWVMLWHAFPERGDLL